MRHINLGMYVHTEAFIRDIQDKKIYDTIVYEDDSQLSTEITVKSLTKDGYSVLKSNGRLLIVLNKMGLEDIEKLISNKDVTIIQPHSGISSINNAFTVQNNDVDTALLSGRKVYEPMDLIDFNTVLEYKDNKNYIRLHNQDYPEDIFDGQTEEDNKVRRGSLIDMTQRNYQGDEGTILCPASFLSTMTLACNLLMQESGQGYDVFAFTNYDFKRHPDLIDSCLNHSKVLIFTDQKKDSKRLKDVCADLHHQKIRLSMVTIISPSYEKIVSTLHEYKNEEAIFDTTSVLNWLKKHQTQN